MSATCGSRRRPHRDSGEEVAFPVRVVSVRAGGGRRESRKPSRLTGSPVLGVEQGGTPCLAANHSTLNLMCTVLGDTNG